MVQRYEQKRRLQWYKRGAAYKINYCFRMPEEEGKWMVSFEVFDELHLQYPMLVENLSTCEEW